MKLGGNSRQQVMGQVLGGVAIAAVVTLFVGLDPSWKQNLLAFCAGLVMAVAISYQLKAFHTIGVSRVMPLTTGGQLIGISLLGVLLFGEWIGTAALPVGILGVALVTVGVLMTAWTEKSDKSTPVPAPVVTPGASGELGYASDSAPEEAPGRLSPERLRRGILETAFCTVFFIAAPTMIRYFDIDAVRTFLPQALGWVIMGFILTFPLFTPEQGKKDDRWSKYTLRAMIPGAMWAIGVTIMQFSQAKVGVAIGFSLSQMGVVISTFGGIWLLGETRTKKEMRVIIIGVAALVLGALVLGVAKSLDVPTASALAITPVWESLLHPVG